MKTTFFTQEQKQALKDGAHLEMHNSFDGEGDHFVIWFNDRWGHWCLQKNAKVIKSTKTLNPILQKLAFDGVIPELTETI
jgi:hypothetical protein